MEFILAPALIANRLTMMYRKHLAFASIITACVRMTLENTNNYRYPNATELTYILCVVATGILPLWTKPKITMTHLRSWNISPYRFTGVITAISTVLYVVTNHYMLQSIYDPSMPFLAVLLVNSLLVNEIKYSEAFFASNWLSESRYGDASALFQFALDMLWVSEHNYCFSFWRYLFLGVPALLSSVSLIFFTDKWLEMVAEHKQKDERALEWNSSESFAFLKKNHGRGVHYFYFWWQYL